MLITLNTGMVLFFWLDFTWYHTLTRPSVVLVSHEPHGNSCPVMYYLREMPVAEKCISCPYNDSSCPAGSKSSEIVTYSKNWNLGLLLVKMNLHKVLLSDIGANVSWSQTRQWLCCSWQTSEHANSVKSLSLSFQRVPCIATTANLTLITVQVLSSFSSIDLQSGAKRYRSACPDISFYGYTILWLRSNFRYRPNVTVTSDVSCS